jgi:hypothetical protein
MGKAVMHNVVSVDGFIATEDDQDRNVGVAAARR